MDRTPRLRRPDRKQLHLRAFDLEELVPPDHLARAIWALVEKMDLAELYDKIGSVEGGPGAPATDPAVLLALWLLGTCEGIGAARELDRRCHRDAPYMWLCGGVGMNHTSLALFRARSVELLDKLLASGVATLAAAGFVNLDEVAVDGRRIRANASASSFRRRDTLETLREEALKLVRLLKARLEDEDSGEEAARRATEARLRADTERLKRIEEALEALVGVEATKARNQPRGKAKATATRSAQSTSNAPSLFPSSRGNSPEPEAPSPGDDVQVVVLDGDEEAAFLAGEAEDAEDAEDAGGRPDGETEGHGDEGGGHGGDDKGGAGGTEGPPSSPADTADDAPTQVVPPAASASTVDAPKKGEARASTTDADATIMKMADGGYRPAFNCQTVVSVQHSVILRVTVETVGSDAGLLAPAVKGVEEKYGCKVKKVLADGGYVNLAAIEQLEGRPNPVELYMPPPRPRGKGSSKRGRYERMQTDSPEVGRWRERLGTPEGATTYRKRSQVAELPHTSYANQGFNRTRTRGKDRVRSELLLNAIAHNLKIQLRLLGRG
jgi:transposase